jgi:hypothetical protein
LVVVAAMMAPSHSRVGASGKPGAVHRLTIHRNGLYPSADAIGHEGVRFEFASATARSDGYEGKGLDDWRTNSGRRAS